MAANYNKNTNCNVNLVKGSVRVQSIGIYPTILVNGVTLGLPVYTILVFPQTLSFFFGTLNCQSDQSDCVFYPGMQDSLTQNAILRCFKNTALG